jgi:hypothetical protein
VKGFSFFSSKFVDDLLLTKSEATVFVGENFDIDFESIQSFSWSSLGLFTLTVFLYNILH